MLRSLWSRGTGTSSWPRSSGTSSAGSPASGHAAGVPYRQGSVGACELMKQVGYPLIKAWRVKRIGKTQKFVVQMVAELV
jgi:hypothetical protein